MYNCTPLIVTTGLILPFALRFFLGTREGGEPFLLHVQWEVGWLDTIRLIEYMTAARRQRSCALMQGVLGIVHLQFWMPMPCVDSCGSSWTVGEGEPFPGRPSGSDLLALDSCMPLLNLINTIIRHYNGRLLLS